MELSLDRSKRLKEMEKENVRLKKLEADLSLDKAILKEVAGGKYEARQRSGELCFM